LGLGFDYANIYALFTGASRVTGNFGTVSGYDATNYSPIFNFNAGEYDLSFAPIPEPSSWLAALFAFAALCCHQRKRIVGAIARSTSAPSLLHRALSLRKVSRFIETNFRSPWLSIVICRSTATAPLPFAK